MSGHTDSVPVRDSGEYLWQLLTLIVAILSVVFQAVFPTSLSHLGGQALTHNAGKGLQLGHGVEHPEKQSNTL